MKKTLLTLFSAIFALISCENSLQTAYESQDTLIANYIENDLASNPDHSVTYRDGVARLTINEGTGAELENGGTVKFYYSGYNFNKGVISSSTLFVTNNPDIASSANWSISDESMFQPATAILGEDDFLEGLEKGMDGVKAGEDCYILFSAKYGIGKRNVGTIPANSALAYRIQVIEVKN